MKRSLIVVLTAYLSISRNDEFVANGFWNHAASFQRRECNLSREASRRLTPGSSNPKRKNKRLGGRPPVASPRQHRFSKRQDDLFLQTARKMRSPTEINILTMDMIENNSQVFLAWTVYMQIEFVKILQEKKAYESIMLLLENTASLNVKVYTTAMFALALSAHHRHFSLKILDIMDERQVCPTSLTFIAVLGSVDGAKSTSTLMKRILSYEDVKLNDEVFNSAIFACQRSRYQKGDSSQDWQVALNFMQLMKRRQIHPTVKTYYAVLQALSNTGQVPMAKSLVRQMQKTDSLEPDDRVWTAAINVCAGIGDSEGAIYFINEMNSSGHLPNLRHVSVLLKTFSVDRKDNFALQALDALTGKFQHRKNTATFLFDLPVLELDLVALNTIISACARAGNIEEAWKVLQRLKSGEFICSKTKEPIYPDIISYHSILKSCTDPDTAMAIVKEMRLSRRNRYGVVVPTSTTYAHAINACQQAALPNVKSATALLGLALDDGIQPTAFMYAPAIWAAQKSGNHVTALDLFLQMTEQGCDPNIVAYRGVISALCDSGEVDHAILIYEEMKERRMDANAAVFKRLSFAIKKLDSVHEQRSCLERIQNLMDPSEKYAECGGPIFEALMNLNGSKGEVEKALDIFASIRGPTDARCLRSVLLACSYSDPPRWQDAVSIIHTSDILQESSGPGIVDQVALGNAMMACAKANECQEAITLLDLYGRKNSGRKNISSKNNSELSVACFNALVASCGRCGRPDLAIDVMSIMSTVYGVKPDLKTYRNVAIACNKAEHDNIQLVVPDNVMTYKWWECSLALMRRMREDGMVPDVATYSATISACEAAGQWQRALGVLQMMIGDGNQKDENTILNLYCFNAAISACEKGSAWVEALELYERMLEFGDAIKPNFVSLNSLLIALENAGQKDLALSKYKEGRKLRIVNPWRITRDDGGQPIRALDLHRFSGAMVKAALRSFFENDGTQWKRSTDNVSRKDLLIITGKGIHSENSPVIQKVAISVLSDEFGVKGRVDNSNAGRIVVSKEELKKYAEINVM